MVYSRARWWVGYPAHRAYPLAGQPWAVAFKSAAVPTPDSHGALYAGVMGPFDTKRAALFYVRCGLGNPHTCTVADCERIARSYAPRVVGGVHNDR